MSSYRHMTYTASYSCQESRTAQTNSRKVASPSPLNYDLLECYYLYRRINAVSLFMGIAG